MTLQGTKGDISHLLDAVKPVGSSWVVYINDEGFKSCYGAFESYEEAQEWSSANGGEVVPLYPR